MTFIYRTATESFPFWNVLFILPPCQQKLCCSLSVRSNLITPTHFHCPVVAPSVTHIIWVWMQREGVQHKCNRFLLHILMSLHCMHRPQPPLLSPLWLNVHLEVVNGPCIESFHAGVSVSVVTRAERWQGDVLIRSLIPIRYGLVLPRGFPHTHTHICKRHTQTHCSIRRLLLQMMQCRHRKFPWSVSKGGAVAVMRQKYSKSAYNKQTNTA